MIIEVATFLDSDWAGDKATMKSTSGAVIELLGTATLNFSRTQGSIALSSAEAELYAIGSGLQESLAIRHLLLEAELFKDIRLVLYTDSTAGKSMATRLGASKKATRVELRFLYVQEVFSTSFAL